MEDFRRENPERLSGLGLCLSGGGYRAMLFHLGGLWRLNELGLLAELDVISSVSGGSIAAGALALAWPALSFPDGHRVAPGFTEQVVTPVRALASTGIDVAATLRGLARPWRSVGEEVAGYYRRKLFGTRKLAELPERPEFVFTSTNLQNGSLWRFSRDYMADYKYGGMRDPDLHLATAVAASSAFPPFLSPVLLPVPRWDLDGDERSGADPRPERVVLSDGGVYDNLGLEPLLKRCAVVLASDGGQRMKRSRRVRRNWPLHLLRVFDVVDNQVRSLRKRQLLESYVDGSRRGAYWAIHSDIAHFELPDALPAPRERTLELAGVPTRLAAVPELTQQRLINWGYAACDAGVRRWVLPQAAAPAGFPYPEAVLG